MKITKKIVGLFALTILFLALGSGTLQAQCIGGTIDNRSNCPVTVNIRLQKISSCALCNETDATIPANSSYSIPCGSCPTLCNIKVRVTRINATNITPVLADWSATSPVSLPLVSPCNTASIEYDLATNTFIIN